jgi:hypothetical protein
VSVTTISVQKPYQNDCLYIFVPGKNKIYKPGPVIMSFTIGSIAEHKGKVFAFLKRRLAEKEANSFRAKGEGFSICNLLPPN